MVMPRPFANSGVPGLDDIYVRALPFEISDLLFDAILCSQAKALRGDDTNTLDEFCRYAQTEKRQEYQEPITHLIATILSPERYAAPPTIWVIRPSCLVSFSAYTLSY